MKIKMPVVVKHFILFFILFSEVPCLSAREKNTIQWDMPGNSFFYGPNQSPSLINAAGIRKEEIYQYTLSRKKIRNSALPAVFFFDSAGNTIKELFRGHKNDTITRIYFYDTAHELIKESYTCTCVEFGSHLIEYRDGNGRPATRMINNQDSSNYCLLFNFCSAGSRL